MSNGPSLIDIQNSTGISIADLEMILSDGENNYPWTEPGITRNGNAYDNYKRPGSFVTQDDIKNLLQFVSDESFRLMGNGSGQNLTQNFLSRLDRHGTAIIPINTMNYGYTFITRPRLN